MLKDALPDFATMRRLAIGFRTLLRAGTSDRLDRWLRHAAASGVYAIQRFARTLNQDIDAVRNAVTETWSNGQTEGQINRLKTLKRAMYGKAGTELLRARMLSSSTIAQHQSRARPGFPKRMVHRERCGRVSGTVNAPGIPPFNGNDAAVTNPASSLAR